MQLLKTYGCFLLTVAMLVGLTGPVWAQDTDTDQAKAAFAAGVDQLQAKNFTEAKATFLKVDRSKLSDDQAKQLDQFLADSDLAIKRQAAGMEAFEKAQVALKENKLVEARDQFAQVIGNDFVPAPIRKEAMAQAALVAKKIELAASTAPTTAPAAGASEVATPEAAAPVAVPPLATAEAVPAEAGMPATTSAPSELVAPTTEPAAVADAATVAQNADRANQLAQQGNAKLNSGNVEAAINSFGQALNLVPGLPAAERGLSQATDLAARTSAAEPLSTLERKRQIALQLARVRFENYVRGAREAVQTGAARDSGAEFTRAADLANLARSVVQSNSSYFTPDEYSTRLSEADNLIAFVNSQRAVWERQRVADALRQTDIQNQARQAREASEKQDRIDTLMANVRILEREYNYPQAIEALNEILQLDPTCSLALGKKESIELAMMMRSHTANPDATKGKDFNALPGGEKEAIGAQHLEEMKQLVDVEWSRVPWYELLTYPRDWREIRAKREPFGVGDASETPANLAVRRVLEKPQPKLDFEAQPFGDVIQFLQDVNSVNIVVNWKTLEAAGVQRTAPITLQGVRDITLDKALRTILQNASTVEPLGYLVEDGVITISTKADLNQNVYTRVYDIRDLIVIVPDYESQNVGVTGGGGGGGGNNGTSGGGGGGIFSSGNNGSGGGNNGNNNGSLSRSDMVRQILGLIISTIDPTSWRTQINGEDGGMALATGIPGIAKGAIAELNGQIVVTQTAENHQAMLNLFKELRKAKALQVNIEARFISVSSGFLNDIGVNMDFFLNIGSSLVPMGGPTAVDPATGARLLTPNSPMAQLPQWNNASSSHNNVTPLPFTQGSTAWTSGNVGAIPGSIGTLVGPPAMQVSGSFLDDIQVDFLVRATQADNRTSTLQAPRITLYNGQRAYIAVVTRQQYIGSLEPMVSGNVAAFRPEIVALDSGTSLGVRATVSGDRRYVTLDLHPRVSQFLGFDTFPIGNQGVLILPRTAEQILETTVSVPDGGTLLVGGLKEAGESQREMGVPGISKIPLINRLFTNRNTIRDERMLLVLVRPKIIVQSEYEDRYFPPE